MGFNPSEIGYLRYAGGKYGFDPLGTADLSDIKLVGETMASVERRFKPHSGYSEQKKWRVPDEFLKNIAR